MIFFPFPSCPNYGVFVDNNLSWAEYDKDNKIFDTPQSGDIVAVLDSVKQSFDVYFGKDYVDKFQISILPSIDVPCAYRKQHNIFLTVRGRRWAQFVYQFSHELCHMMIPENVTEHMRWFEETICELASHFFLLQASKQWAINPPYPNWKDYAPYFIEYSACQMGNEALLPIDETLGSFISKTLSTLCQDCYRRDINRLCAKYLFPVFEANPALWVDVPLLSKIPTKITFAESLEFWKEISSEKQSVDMIITILTTP